MNRNAETKNLTSPRPSPLHPMERRGRIGSSILAKLRLASARLSSDLLKANNGCPLSPGERVRVKAGVNTNFIFVFAVTLLCLSSSLFASEKSPFAKVEPLPLGEARWTDGFWADRFELCRTQMIPSMERLMEGTTYTQFFRNFEIASGLAEGKAQS